MDEKLTAKLQELEGALLVHQLVLRHLLAGSNEGTLQSLRLLAKDHNELPLSDAQRQQLDSQINDLLGLPPQRSLGGFQTKVMTELSRETQRTPHWNPAA